MTKLTKKEEIYRIGQLRHDLHNAVARNATEHTYYLKWKDIAIRLGTHLQPYTGAETTLMKEYLELKRKDEQKQERLAKKIYGDGTVKPGQEWNPQRHRYE